MLKQPMSVVLALPIVLGGFGVGAAQAAPSACDAVSGNLVVNCGFETTGGWSALDAISVAHTGSKSLLLGLISPGATQQTIATVGGQSYSLGFWGSNVGFSNVPFSFAVFFDGTKVGDYTPGVTNSFVEYTASVTASSTSSILRFERTGSFGYGYIDDVVLLATQAPSTDVPEPASLAVLGAGLAGLAGLARRRRRKA